MDYFANWIYGPVWAGSHMDSVGVKGKYSYQFTFPAKGTTEPASQLITKVELQDYINDLLGVIKEKKSEITR